MSKVNETVDAIRKFINAATAPEKLSPQDAVSVLEEIEADCEGMIEALKSDIARDQEGDGEVGEE